MTGNAFIYIACAYVGNDPRSVLTPQQYALADKELRALGYITPTGDITHRGHAWVEAARTTPCPT